MVKIFSDKGKKLGEVKEKKNISSYGVYQKVYEKEEGIDAKKAAKAMMVGITKEATVESLGDVKALAGYAIEIDDKATGLKGTFYISSDSHTFQDGTHMMSLELSWKNEMEKGQEEEDSIKKDLTNGAKCWYIESGSVYHSSTACPSCKGKKTKKSTVSKVKKIKITKGKNKGKRKYKPCSKCWNT
jgi:hypothetical protein